MIIILHNYPSMFAPRKHFSRTMSSLAPGTTLQGTSWNYRILKPVVGDSTHTSTVYKAEIIPRENTRHAPQAPKRALIKASPPGAVTALENMKRERQAYRLPGVASSACFRKMYDEINSSTIALEWLDTTLAEVKYQPSLRIYSLIVAVMRAALTSCVVLEGYGCVNTDLKPANILLSGIETGYVTAKVGDLGLVVPSGSLPNAQPYAMRAPEVFLGHACAEPSQVWAVAAMLLCWVNPGVLGVWDSPHPFINEAWCMAKIKRLFPHWKIPHPDYVEGHSLKAAVDAASSFSKEVSELQAISPLCEELRKVDMPRQFRDLLRLMLVVDSVQRPSASFVLASEEFKALEELVSR